MMNRLYLLLIVGLLASGVGCSREQSLPLAPALAVPMASPGVETPGLWIGPAGGSVVDGGVRLDVPAGALGVPTRIAIERRPDGSVDLTPNGQQFLVPVSLTFLMDAGKDPVRFAVEWFDPAGGWVVIPSYASPNKRVACLMHFSIYRIVAYE
jgi:hypothetical protein